ncbi:MAG: agmatine deiminase family protein [Planctomycetota bacterium]
MLHRFLFVILFGCIVSPQTTIATPQVSAKSRLIAEFEPQEAVLLSVGDLKEHHFSVLKQIVDRSAGHTEIVILYNTKNQLIETVKLLRDLPNTIHISFLQFELDTIWLRDFGPRALLETGGVRLLDFYYYGVRPRDDSFPERWALQTNSKLSKVTWTLQGGNLAVNGQGLGLTTSKLFSDNKISFGGSPGLGSARERDFLVRQIKQRCHLDQLVVLDPLRFESTQHVDMFANFVAADHLLVASIDPSRDRVNSRILNSNVEKLQRVKVGGRPIKIDRIRIPARNQQAWSTYANVIMTDRILLIPTLSTDPPELVKEAIATYRRLLPNHHVDTINVNSMRNLQGALHCMSLNLPKGARLPKDTIRFESASTSIQNSQFVSSQEDPNPKYTIDKQLRRVFKSSNSDYLVDAYAVGFYQNVLNLVTAQQGKLMRVQLSGFCEADRYWVQRNREKIIQHGPAIQRRFERRAATLR